MSADDSEVSDSESDTEPEPEQPARVQCKLGGLELEVECADVEDAEEIFERIWGRRLTEAESFSDALRERMVGHQ